MGRTACVLATVVAVYGLCGQQAYAGDDLSREIGIDRYLLFSGFDLWRGGFSAHSGLVWAPAGHAASGFALKFVAATGAYGYRSGGVDIKGAYELGSALPGWMFKAGKLDIAIHAGLDVQQHRLTPDDPANALRGSSAGLRAGADLWFEPVEGMMAAGSVWISTIGPSYWTRAAAGWRFADAVWVGPEVHAMGDSTYSQWRTGLHATGLRTGAFEWSAGAGYAIDSDQVSGVYGRIGMLMRR